MTTAGRDALIDPHALPFLLGVCDAIEAFTTAHVASDPHIFRPRGVDLRYAIERHLYFAMINNRDLYSLFAKAAEGARDLPARLHLLTEQFAPFLVPSWRPRGAWRRLDWRAPGWRSRRDDFRALGAARVERGDWPTDGPPFLFQLVQAKFLPFLRPIANALGRPYAFLIFEDPALFAQLEGEPRVHITLDDAGRAHLREERYGLLEFFATYLNAAMAGLAEIRPAALVVPEGNAPYNELFNRAFHALGLPSVCIQQGWSPIVHTGFRNMSYDRMCVWGAGFAETLAPFNPAQRFVVTGSHVISPRVRTTHRANGAIAFFLQPGGSPLITSQAAKSMLGLAVWAARQFPSREIRVRPHPGGPLSEAEEKCLSLAPNLRIMPASFASMEEVLENCDIAVSIFSTTILEAAAAGVIPLIVNVAGLPHYNPDIARDHAAVEAQDFETARQALSRLCEDRAFSAGIGARLAGITGRYFARNGMQAMAAMVNEINALSGGAIP